ncbi:MAG: hypothetical protein AAFY64_09370, partial [Pseudomonadota bacterium]
MHQTGQKRTIHRRADGNVSRNGRRTRKLKAATLASVILAGSTIAAIVTSRPVIAQKTNDQQPITTQPYQPRSALGSYLAGKLARSSNDSQAAATHFARALADNPNNASILAQAFLMQASEGNVDQATKLARRLIGFRKDSRLAQLWLGVSSYRDGDLRQADKHFRASAVGPIAELTAQIARSWTALKRGDGPRALSLLKSTNRAEWAQFYSDYHRGMVADLAKRPKQSAQTFRSVLAKDPRQARNVIVAASAAAANGQRGQAIRIIDRHIASTDGVGHESVLDLKTRLSGGGPVTRAVASADHGLAELFYVLGEALSNDGGGTQLGTVYLQLALALRPDFEFARAALAHVYERQKQYARANAIYDGIPDGSPMNRT